MDEMRCMFPDTDTTRLREVMEAFNRHKDAFEINTPLRIAHFLGQIAVESSFPPAGLAPFEALQESCNYSNVRNTDWGTRYCHFYVGFEDTTLNDCTHSCVTGTLSLMEDGCPEPISTDLPECTPIEAICDDGVDNDGDGLVDCDDEECMDSTICDPEIYCEILSLITITQRDFNQLHYSFERDGSLDHTLSRLGELGLSTALTQQLINNLQTVRYDIEDSFLSGTYSYKDSVYLRLATMRQNFLSWKMNAFTKYPVLESTSFARKFILKSSGGEEQPSEEACEEIIKILIDGACENQESALSCHGIANVAGSGQTFLYFEPNISPHLLNKSRIYDLANGIEFVTSFKPSSTYERVSGQGPFLVITQDVFGCITSCIIEPEACSVDEDGQHIDFDTINVTHGACIRSDILIQGALSCGTLVEVLFNLDILKAECISYQSDEYGPIESDFEKICPNEDGQITITITDGFNIIVVDSIYINSHPPYNIDGCDSEDDQNCDDTENEKDNDTDGDGTDNEFDNDDDGDGIPDLIDTTPQGLDSDIDDDEVKNEEDCDLDGDNSPNQLDNDTDGDLIDNELDPDDDNDGILDIDDESPQGPETDCLAICEGSKGECSADVCGCEDFGKKGFYSTRVYFNSTAALKGNKEGYKKNLVDTDLELSFEDDDTYVSATEFFEEILNDPLLSSELPLEYFITDNNSDIGNISSLFESSEFAFWIHLCPNPDDGSQGLLYIKYKAPYLPSSGPCAIPGLENFLNGLAENSEENFDETCYASPDHQTGSVMLWHMLGLSEAPYVNEADEEASGSPDSPYCVGTTSSETIYVNAAGIPLRINEELEGESHRAVFGRAHPDITPPGAATGFHLFNSDGTNSFYRGVIMQESRRHLGFRNDINCESRSFDEPIIETNETVTVLAGHPFTSVPPGGNMAIPDRCRWRVLEFYNYTPQVLTNLTGEGPILDALAFEGLPTNTISQFACPPSPITEEQFDNISQVDTTTAQFDASLGGMLYRTRLVDHLGIEREYIILIRPHETEPGELVYLLWDPYLCAWRPYVLVESLTDDEVLFSILTFGLDLTGDVVEVALDLTFIGGVVVGAVYVLAEGAYAPLILSLVPYDKILSGAAQAIKGAKNMRFIFTQAKDGVKVGDEIRFEEVYAIFKGLGHTDEVADDLIEKFAKDLTDNLDLAYIFKKNPDAVKAWEKLFHNAIPDVIRTNTTYLSAVSKQLTNYGDDVVFQFERVLPNIPSNKLDDFFAKLDNPKSIDHIRSLVGDFENIPGISLTSYVSNSLPKVDIPAPATWANPLLQLPSLAAETFTDVTAKTLSPGQKIYRVLGEDQLPDGSFWMYSLPTSKADFFGGTAVRPEWNAATHYVEYTVPPSGLKVWDGTTARQPILDDVGTVHLPGGKTQIYIPDALRQVGNDFENLPLKLMNW